ncbi:MAG: DUF3619 family protein [Gammaproteobacteria bacterium]|nr:DUF3619 family protein [Gammaproteobacteria bacterium]
MKQSDEDALLAFARKTLDDQADKTSLKVNMRLQKARMQALEAASNRQSVPLLASNGPMLQMPRWVGTASMGTIFGSLILLCAMLWLNPLPEPSVTSTGFEDIQLLSAQDDLVLFRDLDFFIWLSDEEINH